MKFIALLRGINVGGNHKVEMKKLKDFFESRGLIHVETYLNSGNVIFESDDNKEKVESIIHEVLETNYDFPIPTLIKSKEEIIEIVNKIPEEWQNNKEEKTDVAFLFPSVDFSEIEAEIPIKREFADVFYTKGAIIWHIKKENYNKSQLNKLVGRKLYKEMTVRNINTARFLAK